MRTITAARLGAGPRPPAPSKLAPAVPAAAPAPARLLAQATRFADPFHRARLRAPESAETGTVLDLSLGRHGLRVLRDDARPQEALLLFGRTRMRRKWRNHPFERLPAPDRLLEEALAWLRTTQGVRRVRVLLDSGKRVPLPLSRRKPGPPAGLAGGGGKSARRVPG